MITNKNRKPRKLIAKIIPPNQEYLQLIELHTSKQDKITQSILSQIKSESKEKNFPSSCLKCHVVVECINSFKFCPFDAVLPPSQPLRYPKTLKWINPKILTPKGSLER
ncbi:MAG: hypothetical protein ACTSP4_00085 [Candidatus Hodarchaeales archaeon]